MRREKKKVHKNTRAHTPTKFLFINYTDSCKFSFSVARLSNSALGHRARREEENKNKEKKKETENNSEILGVEHMQWASPESAGALDAAEIGRIASKYQTSSSCGKATSPSFRSSSNGTGNIDTANADAQPPATNVSQKRDNDSSRKKVRHATDTIDNDNIVACGDTGTTINVNNIEDTSTTKVAREVRGADKTTINIGVAMNHVNDHDNLNLDLVLAADFEDMMDTQEGLVHSYVYYFHSRRNFHDNL